MSRSIFHDWMKASGFHGKQVTMAAGSLGLTFNEGRRRSTSHADLPRIECLGLTAAYLNLPPWEEGFSDILDEDAKLAVELARRAIQRSIEKATKTQEVA
jgi:hypothetical protein